MRAGEREGGTVGSPPSSRRPMKWDWKSRSRSTCLETGLLPSAKWVSLRALRALRVLRRPEGTVRESVGPKTWKKFWARLHRMSWRAR